MLTYPTVARLSRRAISLAIPLVLVIAACGAAAGPTATPGTQTPGETPTAVPGDGGSVGGQLPDPVQVARRLDLHSRRSLNQGLDNHRRNFSAAPLKNLFDAL